jgi:hypothetical protein
MQVASALSKSKLYCPPPKIVLNTNNFSDILERYAKEERVPENLMDAPIILHFLYALQRAFPCE